MKTSVIIGIIFCVIVFLVTESAMLGLLSIIVFWIIMFSSHEEDMDERYKKELDQEDE